MKSDRDFEGIGKWKKFPPLLYTVNILLTIMSPFYFPTPYHFICFICLTYLTLKGFCGVINIVYAMTRLKQILLSNDQDKNSETTNNGISKPKIPHAIIIPNYR